MQTMKKMFYVLLALLVSMVLVFGVSCDNSNKAPGGAEGNPPVEEPGTGEEPGGEDPAPEEPEYPIDLGTEFAIPDWTVGNNWKANATILGESRELELKVSEDGGFSISIPGIGSVNDESITNITKQEENLVDEKLQYTLEADFEFTPVMGEPQSLGKQTLVVTKIDDSSIAVEFTLLNNLGVNELIFKK